MNKNETKNGLRAKLQLMVSFAEATAKLKGQIINSFTGSTDDNIFDLLDKIQNCETTDMSEIMNSLEKYFQSANIKEGQLISIPYVNYGDCMYSIEVGVQYPNGEALTSYVAESDSGTFQTGSVFYTTDETPLDLTMAEIKKGDLAKVYDLSEDNQDIDLFVWSDVSTEDSTHSFRLKHADILQVLEMNEEGGGDNE